MTVPRQRRHAVRSNATTGNPHVANDPLADILPWRKNLGFAKIIDARVRHATAHALATFAISLVNLAREVHLAVLDFEHFG
jgi:hypothetical protein